VTRSQCEDFLQDAYAQRKPIFVLRNDRPGQSASFSVHKQPVSKGRSRTGDHSAREKAVEDDWIHDIGHQSPFHIPIRPNRSGRRDVQSGLRYAYQRFMYMRSLVSSGRGGRNQRGRLISFSIRVCPSLLPQNRAVRKTV